MKTATLFAAGVSAAFAAVANPPDRHMVTFDLRPGAALAVPSRAQAGKPEADRVLVPAGTYVIGSSSGAADELPVHRVRGSAFAIDRLEVTNARYAACVGSGACTAPIHAGSGKRTAYYGEPAFADHPVVFVSHTQADTYCRWVGGRLPTEAEWERAARGLSPDERTYPWGERRPDCTLANFAGCAGDTDRVGARPEGQSPFGALDMAGNVWEWTADWYDPGYYAKSPATDPRGPEDGALRTMRGGCWQSGASSLRVSCRKAELPGTWAPNVGFRCAYAGGK